MSDITYNNDRQVFIEATLSLAVSEACGWVDHLEYTKVNGFEAVAIVCNNGHKYYANIECDSKKAIIEDVMKVISKH